ncbi:chemotaxis protein CheA [Treponema sp.]|uniref:chemotaxis protein CheA n=1 Tax=Treponema sp. TaxID=166 RepID=UPI00298DF08C|nr:chemotaxis protein CheA [Treponema sp.]MCQ2241281.1 chemotaxis protein CheA [Treponema sp.]
MSDYLDANNEELLKDFFAEAEQQVETLESNILVIENDPSNHDAIDEIFRAAHTLKGGSATVEMTELATFCHDVEDLLDALRGNLVEVTEPIVDTLLTSIDTIKSMLEARSNGSIYDGDIGPLVQKINSYIPAKDKKDKKKSSVSLPAGMVGAKPAPEPVAPAAPAAVDNGMPPLPVLSEDEYSELKENVGADQKLWTVNVTFDESNPMNSVGGIQVFAALKNLGTVLKTVPDFEALYEDEYHPQVVYYIAASCEGGDLEDVAFLDDVTTAVDAQIAGKPAGSAAPATPAPAAAPAPAPAPVASSAPAEQETPAPAAAPAPEKVEESAPEAKAPETPKGDVKKPAAATGHATQTGSILRVDSKRVDNLMNLVSETVITKAAFNQNGLHMADLQVKFQALNNTFKEKQHRIAESIPKYLEQLQNGASMKDIRQKFAEDFGTVGNWFDAFENDFKISSTKYRSTTQNLGRISSELQEGVMKIRMVPIGTIFNRFPRVVRDLSRDLGRKVNLVIEGEETELDKTVVDDLLDPIMHCVRNSVDHGIETPEERAAAGKDETGTLILKASNEGNMIVIDIIDDGQGIEVEKVRNKAIQKGLISPNKVLSNQDAYNLIFLPGFSTSDKISNVSGRGVGLDVVKTMVEKLKGTISVTSEMGKGSKFSIRLPLTLAIIQGLLVRVGKEVYSIPIANVIESQRVKKETINTIDNYEVLNVRNEVISILRLGRLFNIKRMDDDEYCFIVIVGSAEKKIGVMVDALIGEEDVVIKPLESQFTSSPGIAGATVLGDGSVSLIVDVNQLLELGVKQELDAQQIREAEAMKSSARG